VDRPATTARPLTTTDLVPPRAAAALLGVAGVLFGAYPALRPYTDETSADGAVAFTSPAWVLSHLAAVGFFVLLPLGLLGLRSVAGRGTAAVLTAWFGVGAVLPYYGGETFGLQAVGAEALRTGDTAVLAAADVVRFGTAPIVLFAAGVLLLAACGVLVVLAVRRSASGPGWTGLPLGAGLVLFLPQFFAGPPLRIAHGLLMAVGCLLLARWTARGASSA
jgi:hypothetical protein